jgi:sulfur carrier protein ThiS adenylyltransferase
MRTDNTEGRYIRQRDIVPADQLLACKATIIGVGAIGRQVALQLTAMGIPWLQLVDFDTVELSNLASQGYLEADLGKPKVQATADLCKRINRQVQIHLARHAFRRRMDIGDIVFCAVDSIHTRRLIWQAVKDKSYFFADARMTAEVLRVLTACDPASREYYPGTLFGSGEAFQGPCTAKSIIYCANVAAGLVLAQFAKYLRRMPVEPDMQLNLLSSELTVADVHEVVTD